jgi:hypothetical protein
MNVVNLPANWERTPPLVGRIIEFASESKFDADQHRIAKIRQE